MRFSLTAGVALAVLVLPIGIVRAEGQAEIWRTAVKAYLAKDYSQSAKLLEDYLRRETDRTKLPSARFFLAEIYRADGRTDQALPLYASLATAPGPVRTSARYREAEIAYNRGQYERARSMLMDLSNDPQAEFLYPPVRLARIKTDLRLGRVNEAQQVFGAFNRTYPRALLDPEVKFLFGILKEYQGQTIDALKLYEELGDDPLAKLFVGAILESQGRFLPAVEAYNVVIARAVLASHRELARSFKARAFYRSGDFLSAGRQCDLFLDEYPDGVQAPRVALLKLEVLLAQARYGDVLESSVRHTRELAGLASDDQALLALVQAEAYLNLNRLNDAVRRYQDALPRAGPNRELVLLRLAYAQSVLGAWDAAYAVLQDYFRVAVAPDPLAQVLNVTAALETGHDTSAFRSAQTLAENGDPLAELALYRFAEYHLDHQEIGALVMQWPLLEKALAGRTPAVDFRESAAWARLLVAEAYAQQGDPLRAKEIYAGVTRRYANPRLELAVDQGLTWCSFQMQDYAGVLARSDRLLSRKGVPPGVLEEVALLRADAFFNLQQYPDAIRAYRNWLEAHAGHAQAPTVLFQLGWAHYLNKSYLDAVDTWKQLARDHPRAKEVPEALSWVADTYFQAGENAQAREVYQQLLTRYPDAPEHRFHLLRVAQTYFNEQKDSEAIPAFLKLINAYPDSTEAAEAKNGIEAASYRLADRLNSIPSFREFTAKFPDSTLTEDIQYRIGEAYFQKERYDESLQEFLQFILNHTKSPRIPNAQYYVAVCQENLGNTLQASLQNEAFLKNYPQHELAPEMLFRLASNQFALGNLSAAAENFTACALRYKLKEYQPRAWFNAALIFEQLQLPDRALASYRRLVDDYPQDPNAPASWGRILQLAAQLRDEVNLQDALHWLESRKDPETLQRALLNVAAWYQEQGDDARREETLKRLIAGGVPKSEAYSLALVDLASLAEGRKDWKGALQLYERLIRTTSEAKWRDAAQKRIKLLRRILEAK